MRRFFEPAAAPAWLKPVLSSIRAALGDVWDVPLRPFQAETAALPPAGDHGGGIAYDATLDRLGYSNRIAWLTLVDTSGAAFTGNVSVGGNFSCYGHATIGNAASDAHTVNGTLAVTGSSVTVGDGTAQTLLVIDGSSALSGAIQIRRNGTPHVFIGDTISGLGTGSGAIIFCYGNDPILFYSNGSEVGRIAANSFRVGASQVLTTRRTGWGAATGTATRTAFDTGTVTTAQLAERVKALIDDLTTHGLIGS